MSTSPPPLLRPSQDYAKPIEVLDPMSERFANLWRKLDGGLLRPIWPAALGAIIAAVAVAIAGTNRRAKGFG